MARSKHSKASGQRGGLKQPTAPSVPPTQPQPAPLAPPPALDLPAGSPLPAWLWLGPALLFAAACAYGFGEVHGSNDTWIALAAGRQIMQQTNFLDLRNTFPLRDTFSYTFEGAVWYNQNWLSHVYFWLLYDWFGRAWVIYGTWAACTATFACVLLAMRLRCGSWLMATIGAALVAVATRDWVSARPATIQFLCLAALWVLISALLSPPQRGRRWPWTPLQPVLDAAGRPQASRWWPVWLMVPLLLVWGNAHGSFVFGYSMIGMLIAAWIGALLIEVTFGARAAITPWRVIVGAAVACALGVMLTIALGPYGLENFTHQAKVAGSPAFRQVSEWVPPYENANFPPVYRFWIAFSSAFSILGLALLLRLGIGPAERDAAPRDGQSASPYRAQHLLFDLASVAIGVTMVMFARRFAPIFYILAGPAIATWIILLTRGAPLRTRDTLTRLVAFAAWPVAVAIGVAAALGYYRDLVIPFRERPQFDLLQRVTRADFTSPTALTFLNDNELQAHVFTEWASGGLVMFHAPKAQVFIDGRAQQVYDEFHYVLFHELMHNGRSVWGQGAAAVLHFLDQKQTDTVMLRDRNNPLLQAVEASPNWVRLLTLPDASLHMRVGGVALTQLGQRERAGSARWPDEAWSDVGRGKLLIATDPPDVDGAVALWNGAFARDPGVGVDTIPLVAEALVRSDPSAAREFLQQTRAALEQRRMPQRVRDTLNRAVQRAEQRLRQP